MVVILENEPSSSPKVLELKKLLEDEWDNIDPFKNEISGVKTPNPMLAIAGSTLVGGIVFSLWPDPIENQISIWVNGVIVKPEFRRQGIATKLITTAMKKVPCLYALTEIQDLYSKLGWIPIKDSDRGVILQYEK